MGEERLSLAEAKKIAAEAHFSEKGRQGFGLLEKVGPSEREELRGFLRRLKPIYLRPNPDASVGSLPTPKGEEILFYVRPFPGEAQMRAAYEVALEGFLDCLEGQGYPVVGRGVGWVRMYWASKATPLDLDSDRLQQRYVETAYSVGELSKRLLPLLNSVRLADRGISAPKIPVPTLEARDFLAAWYLASLLSVKERLERRSRSIARLEEEIGQLEDEREKTRKLKELERLRKKQAEEEKKYAEALQGKWQEWAGEKGELRKLKERKARLKEHLQGAKPRDRARLEQELKSLTLPLAPWALCLLRRGAKDLSRLWRDLDPRETRIEAVRRLAPYLHRFGPLARQQLNTAVGNKFTKILEEFLRLLSLRTPEVTLFPLLAQTPWALASREAGDKSEICYSCGNPLGDEKIRASKLVFAAPSQRLQSGMGQEEPYICLSCAALALLSPLKPGDGSVLVRIGHYGQAYEDARQFARLLATGSLNVAAGRYLLLNSPIVRAGGGRKPLAQAYGRVVYALQALGEGVNPGVIHRFPFYLLEGAQEIPIPKRALWLSHLLQGAFGARTEEGGEVNRDLGEALRYALSDLPWHAAYTLACRYGRVSPEWERGLEVYSRLLQEAGMTELQEKFKDVAGLTGLLYAWASYVEGEAGRGEAKRPIAKLLDNLKSASTFLYVAAYELDAQEARLYEGNGKFFYGEAKRLLQEAEGSPREEMDGEGRRYLRVSQDDLHRVYAHLAGKYPDKEWEKFTYEVRLSLASRFPQYLRQAKERE